MQPSLSPEAFKFLLGEFPEKPPLNTELLDVQDFDTYTRKLIAYTTEDDERVQAFLLVPRHVRDKVPGILAIHQDGERRPYEIGKSEPAGIAGDPQMRYGLELCQRGYVVICPDRFPFESRRLANSPHADTFLQIFTKDGFELTEDLYAGCVANQLLMEGRTAFGKTLFDLERAVDCLSAEPEVDANRIGVIGHSAGGLYGALLMYIDHRIRVGCASCGTFPLRWIISKNTLRPLNGFAIIAIPGLYKYGDVDDILAGLAPRPFLETSGDGLSEEMVKELTGKARARYEELAASDHYQYIQYDGGHTFRRDMRETSYAWFDRWLRNR